MINLLVAFLCALGFVGNLRVAIRNDDWCQFVSGAVAALSLIAFAINMHRFFGAFPNA